MTRARHSFLFLALIAATGARDIAASGGAEIRTFHRIRHLPGEITPAASPSGYNPMQMRHAYGFDQLSYIGSGQIIAIVDAYDDPTAAGDLKTFIGQFSLAHMNGLPGASACTVAAGPHPCFQVTYSAGSAPSMDPDPQHGWEVEESLDVQWAHAIAPGADILLVEAPDSSTSNMLAAVNSAVGAGAKVVSMSWGGAENAGSPASDSVFNVPGVFFTASAGDNGSGVLYPAASPYVLAVGGSSLRLDGAGNVLGDAAWSGSGGGISKYESEPAYQAGLPIPASAGGKRGVPDVCYDADPNYGVSVYYGGWMVIGGTSAGAPQWAALAALVRQGGGSPSNSSLYSVAVSSYSSGYRDIASGSNGACGAVCTAGSGYDFVTGLGDPGTGLVWNLFGLPQPVIPTMPPIKIYPNPFRPSQGHTAITFVNLPANSTLKLFTLTGAKVREIGADSAGTATWDANNEVGAHVASGVYFGAVQGQSQILKVIVQR